MAVDIVGGGFDEPQYMFTEPDARPPFERAANFGIRAALFDEGDRSPATIGSEVIRPDRDYSRERPVSDAVFAAFHGYFAYDRTPVKATLVETDDSHPDWRRDTVTFPAAYPGETVTVYLFLPKRTAPPYQTLVFLPGAEQFAVRSSREMLSSPPFAHIVRSGRAVAAPIVKGAFERGTPEFSSSISKEGLIWRDYLVAIEKDIARTLDYLETRPDLDAGRMGYIGNSRGAAIAPIVLALEPERLKTAVLMLPGLYLARPKPEVDVFNYLPRVRQPVLMLGGRYDFIFVERQSQVPFFEGLGTPAADKRHVSYDSGHNIPIAEMIKESLDWLDRTLGTVAR
jgi:dienelactone hydrolase